MARFNYNGGMKLLTLVIATQFIWTHFLARGFIGEVYVNGQQQDVWCRSHAIISDPAFYKSGKFYDNDVQPSCYKIYYYTGDYKPAGTLITEANDTCFSDTPVVPSLSGYKCYCNCSD